MLDGSSGLPPLSIEHDILDINQSLTSLFTPLLSLLKRSRAVTT